MATVSERARELRVALAINSFDTERAKLIEQALLAERRLAMEEMGEDRCGCDECLLRAAAEKEVT